MPRLYQLICALAIATTSLVANSQLSEPVLGVQLGQVFKIIKCEGQRDNWCTTENLSTLGASPRALRLMPPDTNSPSALPTWVRRESLYLEFRTDGVVDKFYVTTLGPSVQDRVVDSISGRFGKPKLYEKKTAQNSFGAATEVVSATWETADAYISHSCSTLTTCTVFFATAEAHAAMKARQEQSKKQDKL